MPTKTVSNASTNPPQTASEPWARFAAEGLDRLRAVLERTDPADDPLRRFLIVVIDHTDTRALSAEHGTAPPPPHLIGAFRNGLGEGCLRRDLALYFAEEVADCFARLLAWKAEKVASEQERRRLEELAATQRSLLDGIRKVVLPPIDGSTPDRR